MKKNNLTITEEILPAINTEALELNIDELYTERRFHFRVRKEAVSIYKESGISYLKILCEAIAYYIYKPLYPELKIEPPIHRKYKAALMALNYSDEPVCWIECFERDYEKIEYICKHLPIDEIILLEVTDDINPYLEQLKKKIHYKFHHKITVINIIPETIFYLDPEDLLIIPEWYEISEI